MGEQYLAAPAGGEDAPARLGALRHQRNGGGNR